MMIVAAVAMIDSRASALPDTTGVYPGGLGPGFYPFWAAFVVFASAMWVGYRALTQPQPAEGVFTDRKGIIAVATLGLPMILAVALIPLLGFYIVTGVYMGLFAAVIGRYKWYWVILITIGFPLGLYLSFESGFRVFLPKSIFYGMGLPF